MYVHVEDYDGPVALDPWHTLTSLNPWYTAAPCTAIAMSVSWITNRGSSSVLYGKYARISAKYSR